MRSPIGPILILLGLATTVVLVLVLFQSIGLRDDLDRAREQVAALEARVEAREPGVTAEELRQELDALETEIRELDAGSGGGEGDVGTPAGGSTADDLLERMDEVLERINDLDDRVDEICEGVPVC